MTLGDPIAMDMETVTPNVFTTTKLRGCNPSFVITSDGFIVTNNHVIAEAEEIEVNFQGGGRSYPARIVGRDTETDLALLKLKLPENVSGSYVFYH